MAHSCNEFSWTRLACNQPSGCMIKISNGPLDMHNPKQNDVCFCSPALVIHNGFQRVRSGSRLLRKMQGLCLMIPLHKDERISPLQHNLIHSPRWVKDKDRIIVFTALAGEAAIIKKEGKKKRGYFKSQNTPQNERVNGLFLFHL